MAESDIQELRTALQSLSIVVNRVLEGTSPAGQTTASPSIEGAWQILEFQRDPVGFTHTELDRSLAFRIVEDGPPPTPAALLQRAKFELSGISEDYSKIVRSAFVAGFWAWASWKCYVPYERILTEDGSANHWVVLSSAVVEAPRRVCTRADFERLVGSSERYAIWERFETLFEVHCFCIGVGIPVPPLVKWRSLQ